MAWKFVPGDNFNLHILLGYEKWFRQDLRASQSWFNQVQRMPDSLPGKKEAIKIATDDLKISRDNIEKCLEALRIARVRNLETSKESKKEEPKDKKI